MAIYIAKGQLDKRHVAPVSLGRAGRMDWLDGPNMLSTAARVRVRLETCCRMQQRHRAHGHSSASKSPGLCFQQRLVIKGHERVGRQQ